MINKTRHVFCIYEKRMPPVGNKLKILQNICKSHLLTPPTPGARDVSQVCMSNP